MFGWVHRKIKRLWSIVATFSNYWDFLALYYGMTSLDQLTLLTRNGLRIRARNNHWDAVIITEIFLDRAYLKMFTSLPPQPVIVDIGGYIGDFSLYAAYELGARVITYEPTPENYALLMENVALNGLKDQITCHNAGVDGQPGSIMLNLDRSDGALHASRYMYATTPERIEIRTVSVAGIMADNALTHIDVLKIDCEGCEYDILSTLTPDIFDKIDRIVFEYHTLPDHINKLERVKMNLVAAGYTLTEDRKNSLVAATRV